MKEIDYSEIDKMIEIYSDSEISKKTGVLKQNIWKRRRRNGSPLIKKWDRYKNLLGTMTDEELSRIVGISPNAVTVKRERDGIPPFTGSKERELQARFVKTLSGAKEQVCTPFGYADIVDDATIYELKVALDIVSLHKAIGQLFSYSYSIPGKKLCIVTEEVSSQKYIELCKHLGISVIIV